MKEDHLQSDLSPEESPEGNPAAVPAEGIESDPFKLGYLTPQNSERRMAPVFLRQIEISYYS